MNPMFNNFSKVADSVVTDSTKRSRIIAVAIAVAISNLAVLPTSQVSAPSNHFNMQVLPCVNALVSQFNENLIFDCKAVVEHVRSFWMLRYTATHPSSRPIYSLNMTFFEAMQGVGTFVSPELYQFTSEFRDQILYLSTVAAEIVYSMEQTNV